MQITKLEGKVNYRYSGNLNILRTKIFICLESLLRLLLLGSVMVVFSIRFNKCSPMQSWLTIII